MSGPRSLATDGLHLIHAQRFHFPDFLCILLDGPITGKLARGCHIQDCHGVPMFRILEKEIMKWINTTMSGFMKTVLLCFTLSFSEGKECQSFSPPSSTHYVNFITVWSDVYIALDFWNQNKKFTWSKGTHFLLNELRHDLTVWKVLPKVFSFVVCNPCQSSPSLTILVPLWFILSLWCPSIFVTYHFMFPSI